ncbi:hypothetical protein, partial [Dyella sp. C9]|uniref:hypothetical protein n=1 Tax=Dyella sp. C9 TaxID=2202154 RepID=UPI001E42FD51
RAMIPRHDANTSAAGNQGVRTPGHVAATSGFQAKRTRVVSMPKQRISLSKSVPRPLGDASED